MSKAARTGAHVRCQTSLHLPSGPEPFNLALSHAMKASTLYPCLRHLLTLTSILVSVFAGALLVILLHCPSAFPQSSNIKSNLLPNGGFESGSDGWMLTNEASLDTDTFHSGTTSLRLKAMDNLVKISSPRFAILPNRYYRITVAVKGDTPAEVRVSQSDTANVNLPYAPGTMGALEGPDWQVISNTFWTFPSAAWGRVTLWLNGVNGPVNYDDVSVELLPATTPFSFGTTGAGVDFPGHPSLMGMRIIGSEFSDDHTILTIDTTGAHFVLNANTGLMTCTQTLGGVRDRATVQFPPSLGTIRTLVQDSDRFIISTGRFDLAFHGDSMVFMALKLGNSATIQRTFTPAFSGWRDGFLTAIDDIGGMAIFPGYQHGTGVIDSYSFTADANDPPASVAYTFGTGGRVALAIFPPRQFDWKTSFTDQVIHTDLYPSTSVINDWSAVANVLVLHESIWRGRSPKIYDNYNPKNAAELHRVIKDAHAVGMKVLPYFTSYYYPYSTGDVFFTVIRRLREEYGFDGVYYDGVPKNDWEYAYEVMRRTRDLFPSGPIYLHNTAAPPFGRDYTSAFLPQIDSWADYTLKGESIPIIGWEDPYLTYVARGFKVSNTIGTLKYDKMLVDGKTPTLAQILSGLPNLNMRERISAYPSSSGWPATTSMSPEWSNYHARIANLRAQWEAGQMP